MRVKIVYLLYCPCCNITFYVQMVGFYMKTK